MWITRVAEAKKIFYTSGIIFWGKGGMKVVAISGILFAILVGSIFLFHKSISFAEHVSPDVVHGWSDTVVFSQIKVAGNGGSTDEFIELYNPTEEEISLAGWKIGKYTKSNTSTEQLIEIAQIPEGERIAGYGYYLLSHASHIPIDGVVADIIYSPVESTETLSDHNTVVLLDAQGLVVDLVGYGEATLFEGVGPAIAPTSVQGIMRKIGGDNGNGIDTNSNVDDWFRTTPGPRNSASDPRGLPVVTHAPVATFVVSDGNEDNEFFIGQEILFDATLSNDDADGGVVVQYLWNFGNGATSTVFTPTTTHVYDAVGTYSVTLSVLDLDNEVGSVQLELVVLDPNDFPVDEEEGEPVDDGTDDEQSPGEQMTGGLVINEFVSEPISGEKEWIELYNASSSTIDLSGVSVWDGAGKIASPTGTIAAGAFFIIELSSSKLNNSGDRIMLKDQFENILDQVTYGSWDDDVVSDNAKKPTSPNSVARNVDGRDTDRDIDDFTETTTVTKGGANTITSPEPLPSSSSSGGGGGGSGSQNTTPSVGGSMQGVVVINELVSNPLEDQDEFVELYNSGSEVVQLTGWWIEDGSKAKTLLSGVLLPQGYVAIDNPKGKLNNNGDIVTVFSANGTTVDWLAYGDWVGTNHPPAPEKGKSLSRKKDGVSTGKAGTDFTITDTITKGGANVISTIDSEDNDKETFSKKETPSSNGIAIAELFPNPSKASGFDEFIELYNGGGASISLKGWKLKDASKKSFTLPEVVIQPEQFLVFYKKDTGIALNNSGSETVYLFDSTGEEKGAVSYTGAVPKDQSFVLSESGWVWTTTPTPGKTNTVSENLPPIAVIDFDDEVPVGMEVTFDASRSSDPEGGEVSVEWVVEEKSSKGSLVSHTFGATGVYQVMVTLLDSHGAETSQELVITVKDKDAFIGGPVLSEEADLLGLRIEEIYPYPNTGEEEFIELFHGGLFPLNLSLYQIDDAVGGSRPYKIPSETIIEPGQYLVFTGSQTGLTLNNSSDSVRLLSPIGLPIQEVSYGSTIKQASYSNIKGNWEWSMVPTPGKENVNQPPVSKKSSVSTSVKKAMVTSGKKVSTGSKVKPVYETTLAGVRTRNVGDKVQTEGVVSVLPGVYGSQYFYLVDALKNEGEVSSGVQVYMYSREFPEVAIGDRVRLTGELVKSNGELRIKMTEAKDIQILSSGTVPLPKEVEIAGIAEPYEGWLVSVTGEVTEVKSTHLYVDDGSEEIKVYFKQGAKINAKLYRVGDTVQVTAQVNRTKTGYQLLPRSQDDLVKISEAETPETFVVAGTVGSAAATAKMYLTTTAAGITSVLLGLAARARGAMVLEFLKRVGGVALAVMQRWRG